MSAQASAKAPIRGDEALRSEVETDEDRNPNWSSSLRVWRQVVIAELLNLLEKRRYDACK
jgi:hypothetical protein